MPSLARDRQGEIGASRELAAGAEALAVNSPGPISARSISQSVWASMKRGPFEGTVLAVFQHACLMLLPGDRVVALVPPEIGDGPLNIVLERLAQSAVFSAIEPGMAANLEGTRLRIGEVEVALDGAETWEARLDWAPLRQNQERIRGRLPLLRTFAIRHSPTEPGLTGLRRTLLRPRPRSSCISGIEEALQHLEAGWAGNLAHLQSGAARLAGMGRGLTPAGDDFLIGFMLWAWLAHPMPRPFCQLLLESTAPRTTTLSAAFLRAAAEGECSIAWHDLLAALDGGMEHQLAGAVKKVLSFGHTSGADALTGFLWMGLASAKPEIARTVGDL